MTVFAISEWRNGHKPRIGLGRDGPVIPDNIITKPPSAELRPDQKDSDSLPDYPILDKMLHALVEEERSVDEVVAQGFDRETVIRINGCSIWRNINGGRPLQGLSLERGISGGIAVTLLQTRSEVADKPSLFTSGTGNRVASVLLDNYVVF